MELLAASRVGDVAKLRVLLAAGGAPREARDENGVTAFLWACGKGHADCAEALLAAGCDAAAVNNSGDTGLMLAASHGHAALLPQLLAGGVPREARRDRKSVV